MTASAYGISDVRHGVDLLERLEAVGTGAIIAPESAAAKQVEHETFLEGAYRRYLQMDRTDPDDWWFRVARKKPPHDERREIDPEHDHSHLAKELVARGWFIKHESKRRHWFRITEDGIAVAESQLARWDSQRGRYGTAALIDFNYLADALKLEGLYILPEPYRGWWYEAAFEEREKGWRHLYRYQWIGPGHNWGWMPYEGDYYYSTVTGYQIKTSQDELADVPF
jgi:hypothetical protein